MKFVNVFIFCVLHLSVYSQTKKGQIENLSISLDSLNIVVNKEKQINSDQSVIISELNREIKNLNDQIKILNSSSKNLETLLNSINQEFALIKIKNDSLTLIKAEIEKLKLKMGSETNVEINNDCSKFTIWGITIGESDDKSVGDYLKFKKSQGEFTELSIGTIDKSKSPFYRCKYIKAYNSEEPYGRSNLGGILSYKCSSVRCYFDSNDNCIGLDIDFMNKEDYPSDLFNKQVADMEKLFSEKATMTIETDAIGGKMKIATIKKENINVQIKDDLKTDNIYGSKIYIFCNKKN